MAAYPKFRDVHLYVGLALLIPIVLIAGTGMALNHEELLGLKPHKEKEHERHGGEKEHAAAESEKAVVPALHLRPTDWAQHSDSIHAALAAAEQTWGDVPLEKIELKHEHDYGLVVKLQQPKQMGYAHEEILWSVSQQAVVEHKGGKMAGLNWKEIIHDLHTGQLFSRDAGFLWSDITAAALMTLTLTGLVLYVIPLLKKRAKKNKPPVAKAARPAKPAVTVVDEEQPEMVSSGSR